MVYDHAHVGLTLREHPVTFLRQSLARERDMTCAAVSASNDFQSCGVAVLVLIPLETRLSEERHQNSAAHPLPQLRERNRFKLSFDRVILVWSAELRPWRANMGRRRTRRRVVQCVSCAIIALVAGPTFAQNSGINVNSGLAQKQAELTISTSQAAQQGAVNGDALARLRQQQIEDAHASQRLTAQDRLRRNLDELVGDGRCDDARALALKSDESDLSGLVTTACAPALNTAALAEFYPDRAQRLKKTGSATIRCFVLPNGKLDGCKVISEEPVNYGFGKAALKVSRLFVLKPGMRDRRSAPDFTTRINFDIAK